MADYKEKIDEWQKAALRKARELDEKYAISDLVEEGSRVAGEAAKRGAETFAGSAEKMRAEAERLTNDAEVSEAAKRMADEAVRGAKVSRIPVFLYAGGVDRAHPAHAGRTCARAFLPR